MGIPREVILARNDSNFLFLSENKMGPGDYNPAKAISKSPSCRFGSDNTKPRVENLGTARE